MAEAMISPWLLVARISGSMMEMLGTMVRLMMLIFTWRSTSVMMQNWEMSEPLPAVEGMKIMGGRGISTRLAPS